MAYELIKQVNELLIAEEKDKTVPTVAKTAAKATYHRDYIKTRNKKYRKEQDPAHKSK